MKVSVIGAGAFGTAIATILAHNDHSVTLWCFEQDVVADIEKTGINNAYLPDITLDRTHIHPTTDLTTALTDAPVVFQAIPVPFLRTTLKSTKAHVPQDQVWVSLSKGIETDTLMLPFQIITDVFGEKVEPVVMSGPNFAVELAQQHKTGTLVATQNKQTQAFVRDVLANEHFIVDTSSDIIGADLCGALKNVLSIIIGKAYGSGQTSKNTLAYLVTRGLAEMAIIVQHFKGDIATVYGFAGVGDLILSATTGKGRNYQAGVMLGKGKTIADIEQHFASLPEGIKSAQAIRDLVTREQIKAPLYAKSL